MPLRFQRRIQLLPGLRLNLSKRGLGISAGVPGLRAGVDAHGRPYGSAGVPGTGLSARKTGSKADLNTSGLLALLAAACAAVLLVWWLVKG